MKFTHKDYAGRETGPYTAEEAVAYEVEKAGEGGQLEWRYRPPERRNSAKRLRSVGQMSQDLDKLRTRHERIARLDRRLAKIAEDDAKERVSDPVVSVLKGILDLMKDETR